MQRPLVPTLAAIAAWLAFSAGNGLGAGTRDNLLENGGFENGMRAWQPVGGRSHRIVENAGRGGGQALCYHKETAAATNQNPHADQVITVASNVFYAAEAYIKATGGLRPTLRIADENWQTIATAKPAAAAGWQRVLALFRTPSNGPVRVQFFGGAMDDERGAEPGTSWCDDVVLRPATDAQIEDAAQARLHIDAGAAGRGINPLFFGVNLLYMIDDDAALADHAVAARLKAMPCRLVRYPGGDMADNYLWKSHALDNPRWWPRVQGPQTTDTDECMAFCRRAGAEAIFVVNLESGFTGDLDTAVSNAVDWVRYCRRKGYRVRYWEIGNETYLFSRSKGHAHKRARITATQYGDAFVRFARAMKAADPSIRIGAVGPRAATISANNQLPDGSRADPREPVWWPTVLDRAGENVDFAVVHQYFGGGHITVEHLPDVRIPVDREVAALKAFLKQRCGREVPVALTEWNINKRCAVRGMAGGVMLAELIARYLAGGVDMATFWPLRFSGGDFGPRALLDRQSNQPRLPYHVMQLFARNMGDRLIPVTTTATDLYAIATRDGTTGALRVFVINRPRIRRPRLLELDVAGFDRAAVTAMALGAADPTSEDAALRPVPVTWQGRLLTCRTHPFSILMITFTP